jgi:hypothetical protein
MSIKTCLLAALTTAIAQTTMPVAVSNLVTGPQSHVRLTNTASQPVTAWSLAITTTSSDSNRTRREVETADGYLSEVTHGLPGSSERLERLMPGQSREISLDPLPDGARVEVVATVLDDGTAFGAEEFLAPIFAKRAAERDALKAVVDTFRDVAAESHGSQAVEALQRRLSALSERDEGLVCRAALDAVQSMSKKTDSADIDRSLENYASFVKREYDLAAKHARRR